MLTLYTWSTPNGQKASIMLEEMDVPYRTVAINIGKGAQHRPEYRRISPNGKIPALTDDDLPGGNDPAGRVFESGNILLYLAEKYGRLLPESGSQRTEVLGWLFFQVGHLGPMVGQWHWFDDYAPATSELASKRYREETLRLLEVLNGRLGEAPYLGGVSYSIADVAMYPWATAALREMADKGGEAEAVSALSPLRDWAQRVGERPAVQRGMKVPDEKQKEASQDTESVAGPAGGGTVLP